MPIATTQTAPPVTPTRRQSRSRGEDRRRQLLMSAIECFARKGFSGTKTKDIAAAAGVSEAILFRHFATKEDLYHAILDSRETRGARERIEELEELAAKRDDAGVFRNVAASVVRSFREDPAFHRLLLYASLEGHLLASLFYTRFGLPMGDFLRRYIVLRQREGAFQECDPKTAIAFVFGSVVYYAMTRHLFGCDTRMPAEKRIIEDLVRLVMQGLERRKGDYAKDR